MKYNSIWKKKLPFAYSCRSCLCVPRMTSTFLCFCSMRGHNWSSPVQYDTYYCKQMVCQKTRKLMWNYSSHYSKQTLALWQASEESACFLLSFFCDD